MRRAGSFCGVHTPLPSRGRLTAAVVTMAAAAVVLGVTAAPALADNVPATPNGQNGSTAPISGVATILLFVGIPVLVIAVAAIFLLPARAVGALRYRPGRPWGFVREWFGSEPDKVVGELPSTGPGAAALFQAGGARGNW